MLDEYLAFCERILLRPADELEGGHLVRVNPFVLFMLVCADDEKILTNYFPLGRSHVSERKRPSRDVTTPRRSHMEQGETDRNVLRPGEEYAVYHANDMFGSVPEEYEVVLKRGSEVAGVPEEYLCGVVESIERRIKRSMRKWSRDLE